MVFDDVHVPWEHVFVYRDVELVNAQFHETPRTRGELPVAGPLRREARVLAGLAIKLAEVHAASSVPPCRPRSAATSPRCAPRSTRSYGGRAASAGARRLRAPAPAVRLRRDEPPAPAHRRPDADAPRAGRRRIQRCRPRSGFVADETARTPSATTRRDRAGRERVKLLKLIWDLVGTEFGGRQLQYEMFYSAAQPVVAGACSAPTTGPPPRDGRPPPRRVLAGLFTAGRARAGRQGGAERGAARHRWVSKVPRPPAPPARRPARPPRARSSASRPPPRAGRLLRRQPDRVELAVQVVARRDRPSAHARVVRDDAVPPEQRDHVDLLVEQPLPNSRTYRLRSSTSRLRPCFS